MHNAHAKPVVLVIDDAPESIDVLRELLGKDYQVRAAINGRVGLRVAEEMQPDIILLDVIMPELDGYEVCRRLNGNPATAAIPVMFVTNLAEASNETYGLALGAVDYITKPFVPALVRSRVQTHLTLRDQSRALELKVKQRTAELVETRLEIIRRLGRAAEYRDNQTGLHVIRMSHYARLIALAAGLGELGADLVMNVAPMHDVGKIGIPDRVLLKPGSLAADEWLLMQQHTTIGGQIIGDHNSDLLRAAKVVAIHHHEWWDGSGYPAGLQRTDIPVHARIVALADVFDALTSDRPYKAAWSVDRSVEYMSREAGRHFDPELVSAFMSVLPDCLDVRNRYRDT
jgi:putative two-component system response regulator